MDSSDFGSNNIASLGALLDLFGIIVGHRHIRDLVCGSQLLEVGNNVLFGALRWEMRDCDGEHRGVYCRVSERTERWLN